MSEIYRRSPEEALEEAFRREEERLPWSHKNTVFVWQSLQGLDGKTRYGSYRHVSRHQLVGREYKIEFWDGMVSIFWTDVLHDPRRYKSIPKSALAIPND